MRYFYSVALGQPNVGDAPQDFCGGARAPGVGSPGGGMSGLKSVRYRYRLLPHVLALEMRYVALRWPTKATIRRALQAYLGHRNIQHTVRYTELSPGRFKDFWR